MPCNDHHSSANTQLSPSSGLVPGDISPARLPISSSGSSSGQWHTGGRIPCYILELSWKEHCNTGQISWQLLLHSFDASLSTGLTTVLRDRMRCKEMSLWNDASGNWYAKEDALRRRQDCRRARPATLHHLVGHHRQWSIEGFHSALCKSIYTLHSSQENGRQVNGKPYLPADQVLLPTGRYKFMTDSMHVACG